ncbi:MAG: Brp/Blh family beta-carotene 15,15'-monooxygenase [Paraglaciecola psychrophila]|jgi:Brp/Blh family beta-carotene 15,15'-monooxygenase
MTSWDLAAIAAVLLIGVPHGGLDGAVARRIGWPTGLLAWFGFNVGYSVLTVLVVVLWWQWPVLGLAIFLALSALHFGRSDIASTQSVITETSGLQMLPLLAHAGLVSIAIPNLQASAVLPVFTLLVGDDGALMLLQALDILFIPWLCCVAAYGVYGVIYPVWRMPLLNLVVLLVLMALLPPLVSFALYFCLWHSRSHMLRVWHSLSDDQERRRSFIEAALYTLIAWITMLLMLVVFQESFSAALIQLTFIGLAALTVPHMLLVDLAEKINLRRLLR